MTEERFIWILREVKRICGINVDWPISLEVIGTSRVKNQLNQIGVGVEEVAEFNKKVWRDVQETAAIME
jgi:hypothetical protein